MSDSSTNLFETGIRPSIDNWLLEESKKVRDYGDYWSASSGGYCMRLNIFKRLGVPPIETDADARKQRVFTSGHLFHDWIQSITKAAGLSIAQELELQDEELMIRGHIDDLVLVNEIINVPELKDELHPGKVNSKRLILYDYKTRNSRNFDYAKTMSFYHHMQLATYMYMLRNSMKSKDFLLKQLDTYQDPGYYYDLVEARVLNLEKDTLRMVETQLLWSDELEKEVLDYWTTLNKYWTERKIPPCTCADHEGGFMGKEKWNPYWYQGEPCSLEWYKLNKKENSNVNL